MADKTTGEIAREDLGKAQTSRLIAARRVLLLFIVLVASGVPAGALTARCAGRACVSTSEDVAATPFCSLSKPVRGAISRGFREGRSPDVLAVTRQAPVRDARGSWVSSRWQDEPVPLVFWGEGVATESDLPPDVGLVDVASTIADVIGFRRDHPEVRAGRVIPGVANGRPPALVVQVVLHGVTSADVEEDPQSWALLRRLLSEGAGTLAASVDFAPTDVVAVTSTIGAGGYPSQHGMTGEFVRDAGGEVVRAWGRRSPPSVIATLGDQLDERYDQRAEIGLVGLSRSELGLIGGSWFVDHDRDIVRIQQDAPPDAQATAAVRLLNRGSFGRDEIPDLLALTMRGGSGEVDAALERVVSAAEAATSGSSAIVVTGTPGRPPRNQAVPVRQVVNAVERQLPGRNRFVSAAASSGLFLDQKALAAKKVSDDDVIDVLRDLEAPTGGPLFADVFPGLAVSFSRYCDE